jgi:hypothetical protein
VTNSETLRAFITLQFPKPESEVHLGAKVTVSHVGPSWSSKAQLV